MIRLAVALSLRSRNQNGSIKGLAERYHFTWSIFSEYLCQGFELTGLYFSPECLRNKALLSGFSS